MKNLFLIDGASGVGKSDLLRFTSEFNIDASYVKKYTTRPKRDYEDTNEWKIDLMFVTNEEFENLNLEYQYIYEGYSYGFRKVDLDRQLSSKSNVFMITRNVGIIKQLQKDYKFINVVPVFLYVDRELVVKRLKSQGLNDKQIKFRLGKLDIAYQNYLGNSRLYKEVLVNISSIDDFHRIIHDMLSKYQSKQDIDENLVFVLMSFNPDNPELVDFYHAMQRAVKNHKNELECINLKEVGGTSYKISETSKEYIRKCRLAIIDLTETRADVLYELGYAHGIGKDCIITVHGKIPELFYPREYKQLSYKNASHLEELLASELRTILPIQSSNDR